MSLVAQPIAIYLGDAKLPDGESAENLDGTAGTDTDIFVARSTDYGQTWSAPTTLNTNADSDAIAIASRPRPSR